MIINSIIGGNGGETASIFVIGLSETDTVTATKDGKTYSGKWVSKPNPACIVPDGYTQLEYIESTGTQYIDTGLAGTEFRGISIDFMETASAKWGCLFGLEGLDCGFEAKQYDTTAGTIRISAGGVTSTSGSNGTYAFGLNNKANVTIKNGTVSANGNTVLSYSDNGYACNTEKHLLLNMSYITSEKGYYRYYYAIIYGLDNETIIRNFVPCKRSSDNAIGMYDLVTNTFYGNSGTGTFVAGEEVPQTIDGLLIDSIKSYGTYTITATDGTNTATQDVLVGMATQYDVEMTLSGKLFLYNLGDECEDVTGGWSTTSWSANSIGVTPTVQKNDDYIHLNRPSVNDRGGALFTEFEIDTTKYSKIGITVNAKSTYQFSSVGIVQSTKRTGVNKDGLIGTDNIITGWNTSNTTFNGTKLFDCVQTTGYIGIFILSPQDSSDSFADIYAVWLE